MYTVPQPMIVIKGTPIDEGFHVGLLLNFTAKVVINPGVDILNELLLNSSWTTPRRVGIPTNTIISSNYYFSSVSVNLQNTTLDSGTYTVYFSILSDRYLMGVNANYSRTITVDGKPKS